MTTVPKERPETRKERREIVRQNYLAGKARRPIVYYSLLVEKFKIIFCKEIFEMYHW